MFVLERLMYIFVLRSYRNVLRQNYCSSRNSKVDSSRDIGVCFVYPLSTIYYYMDVTCLFIDQAINIYCRAALSPVP